MKQIFPSKLTDRMATSALALAFALAALAGCAAEPVGRHPRRDAASLPKIEAARTRADREEIAAWYEREAASAGRQVDVHLRMGDIYALPYPDYSGAEFTEHCRNLILRHQQAAESNRALALPHSRLTDESME